MSSTNEIYLHTQIYNLYIAVFQIPAWLTKTKMNIGNMLKSADYNCLNFNFIHVMHFQLFSVHITA